MIAMYDDKALLNEYLIMFRSVFLKVYQVVVLVFLPKDSQ